MRIASRALLALLPLVYACEEAPVGNFNSPPQVAITSPASETVVDAAFIELVATAIDSQDSASELLVEWTSSELPDVLNTDPPDDEGTVNFVPPCPRACTPSRSPSPTAKARWTRTPSP